MPQWLENPLILLYDLFMICCLHVFLVEFSTLTRDNGKTRIKILGAQEVEGLIKEHEQVKAEEAKQAAAKK